MIHDPMLGRPQLAATGGGAAQRQGGALCADETGPVGVGPQQQELGADTINLAHLPIDTPRPAGVRPGVVLNPSTPLEAVSWVLADVDFVLSPSDMACSFIHFAPDRPGATITNRL